MSDARDHITQRLNAARVKLEARRSASHLALLALAVLGAFVGLSFLLARVAPTVLGGAEAVSFRVESARAVRGGLNEIRVKGIPAGRITNVALVDGRPVVTAEIKKEFGEVYQDARAELRPNSALEDQYINIVSRGTPRAGKVSEDKPLAASRTTTPIWVSDVLDTLDVGTRAHLRTLLADLGSGLRDRGAQLNDAFAAAVPLLAAAKRLTDELGQRAPLTKRLVRNVGVLTAELGVRNKEIKKLVRAGGATMSALDASAPQLDATLQALPGTLATTDASLTATRRVLGDVDGAVTALGTTVDRLTPALRSVERLSDDARPVVARLQRPVQRLLPLSRRLRPLSTALATTVERLRPQTGVVDRLTKNLVACETGVKGFFQWDASMTKYGDARGQVPRGNLNVGLMTLGLSNPEERAYQGCTPGGSIGARPPRPSDER